MDSALGNGYAFICEGETERIFYGLFLTYLCKKHGASLTRNINQSNPDIYYNLQVGNRISPVKFKTANAITQVPKMGHWFETQCVGKTDSETEWYVFLCYDQDDYKADISKFQKGDWVNLRNSLKKAKQVIDIAAAADIEDVMLQDLKGICAFLGCELPETLRGGKGKIKLKNLFRQNGQSYHEGKRAEKLIESLNMEVLIEGNLVSLGEIEKILFK